MKKERVKEKHNYSEQSWIKIHYSEDILAVIFWDVEF